MRLIDADTLIGYVESTGFGAGLDTSQEDIIEAIERCPLAYDVDKVVDQLEKEESKARLELMEDRKTAFEFSSKSRLDAYKKALEIVKGGGTE